MLLLLLLLYLPCHSSSAGLKEQFSCKLSVELVARMAAARGSRSLGAAERGARFAKVRVHMLKHYN